MAIRKISLFIVMFSVLIFTSNATAQSTKELQEQMDNLQARVRQLEDYLVSLQTKINDFHEQMRNSYNNFQDSTQTSLQDFSLRFQNNLQERMKALDERVVILDIVSKEYRKIDTNSGHFLITIKKVQPAVLEGYYRLTFNIGNPNYASYSGIKLNLRWGESFKGGVQTYEQWQNTLVSSKYSYNAKIPPGSWIEFFVDVPVQSTKELEYMECSMGVETIELNLKNPL